MIRLLTFLSGPTGKMSSMRVNSTLVVWVIMLSWGWVSVKKLELQPLGEIPAALVLGVCGIQVAHKHAERRANGGDRCEEGQWKRKVQE